MTKRVNHVDMVAPDNDLHVRFVPEATQVMSFRLPPPGGGGSPRRVRGRIAQRVCTIFGFQNLCERPAPTTPQLEGGHLFRLDFGHCMGLG